jgi:NTE family protein
MIPARQGARALRVLLVVDARVLASREAELRGLADVGDVPGVEPGPGVAIRLPSGANASVLLYGDPSAAVAAIRERPVDAILLDNRGENAEAAFSETVAGRILPELLAGALPGRAPARRSILVVLPDAPSTPHHAYAVGTLHMGGVIVSPPSLAFALEAACRTAAPAGKGKVALCLAGGGIEGMFYELGVLRALDTRLGGQGLADFDIFAGISAGAVLASFLANGVRPAEIADALRGKPSRVAPISRGMLFEPNLAEIAGRAAGAAGDLLRGRWISRPIDSALKVTPTAIFSGDKLRRHLESEFKKPGMTDDFARLARELYIGATDQDTLTHVTFGEKGLRDVPISHAVRASAAMTPYYAPEKINGRFYVDGIFTRTLNLDVAVEHGARLIICVDPLTPVQAAEPGYVSSRGGFFNTVQSVKSMIRTRFSEVISRADEVYPDAAVYLFSPTPHDMEQMSGTLMRFFYRTETEEMGFVSACQRIDQDHAWLGADLARFGFELKGA